VVRNSGHRRMTKRGRFTVVFLAGLVGSASWAAWPGPAETTGPPPLFPVASSPLPEATGFVASVPVDPIQVAPAQVATLPAASEPPPPKSAPEPELDSKAGATPAPESTPAVVAAAPNADGWRDAWRSPPVSRGATEAMAVSDGRYTRELAEGSRAVQVRYTLDPTLTDSVWKVLKKGRVALGHVVVMDVETGALHVYASTDPERFPPQGVYPAASLVKVVTAAAALDEAPEVANEICRYAGNPYRLRRSHLTAPRRGNEVSLKRALATSNNQCFARLAVDRVGSAGMLAAIDQFGLLRAPAFGHARGMAKVPDDDPLALGKLGSGLDGLRITPLHAVQLAAILAHGRRVEPYWIEGGESGGRVLPQPDRGNGESVVSTEVAAQLRTMLVETTQRGTARRAFRTRRGRPLLQKVTVAGKTGSLNGTDPDGRYEWFIGVAPAEAPRIAVATLAVQSDLYWMSASQLAAEVFKVALCPKGVCRVDALNRLDDAPIVRTASR
jgi:hypothetical protein